MDETIQPLLTIAIPTFNRAPFLDRCLSWIYNQIEDSNNFEVVISDNNSNDNTKEIVTKYMDKYNNLKYYKQNENVGFDKNLKTAIELSRGRYIKLHGDDDILSNNSLKLIEKVVEQNKDIDLFNINCGLNEDFITCNGLNNYIMLMRGPINLTSISQIIIKKSAYTDIENKNIYLDSGLYQVYILMEILKNNPKYVLIGNITFNRVSGMGGSRMLNLGHIALKNYLDILCKYVDKGFLDIETLKKEKEYYLNNSIIPTLKKEVNNRHLNKIDIDITDFEEIFIEYYREEPYFNEKFQVIKSLLNILNKEKIISKRDVNTMSRSNTPILTIGIPTFNRASILEKSLNHIYSEIGNSPMFEVVISDNNSTDNTSQVVSQFMSRYNNLVYHKQNENLGFDRNLKTVLDISNGEYIKIQSDDDFLNRGALIRILNIVKSNPDTDLFAINIGIKQKSIYKGQGYDDYFEKTKCVTNISVMSLLTIKNSAYKNIQNKERFLDSALYQVFLQMEILKNNPRFCVLGGMTFIPPSGSGGWRMVSLGDISISNYFEILYTYLEYGLDLQTLKKEKKHYLYDSIIPVLKIEIDKRKLNKVELDLNTVEHMFMRYYRDEEYYLQALYEVRSLLNQINNLGR